MADELSLGDIESAIIKGEADRLGVPESTIRFRRLIEAQNRETDEMNRRHAEQRRKLVDGMRKSGLSRNAWCACYIRPQNCMNCYFSMDLRPNNIYVRGLLRMKGGTGNTVMAPHA